MQGRIIVFKISNLESSQYLTANAGHTSIRDANCKRLCGIARQYAERYRRGSKSELAYLIHIKHFRNIVVFEVPDFSAKSLERDLL